MTWLLYGATGYTGQLLVEQAVARGHRPIIAGRSREKLLPIAERYDLEYAAFPVDQAARIRDLGVELVLNIAGPYVNTGLPIQQACLDAGVHCLDITGEISVFQQTFALDAQARARGVALISGVGFDIVPTDCLARFVAEQVLGATHLEIAFDMQVFQGEFGVTAGTLKSIAGMLSQGARVTRNGVLLPYDLGRDARVMAFPDGPRHIVPLPWGDVYTAIHATGIPNITAYIAVPEWAWHAFRLGGVLMQTALQSKPLHGWLDRQFDRFIPGPSAERRAGARTLITARAFTADGRGKSAWLETHEAYEFTRHAAILAVERVLDGRYVGALTPSMAFGADFVLDVPNTRRFA
jgi:short subunit dehydrogenase-like uncharacterized protein